MVIELESKLVGINNFETTDFSDEKPLKTERIGSCVVVAFYHNKGSIFGALPHPIKCTNPKLFFSKVVEYLPSVDTSAAIIGNKAYPESTYFIESIAKLLEKAGYDVLLKGLKEEALRDVVLHPNGTLEVYYSSYDSQPELEKTLRMG